MRATLAILGMLALLIVAGQLLRHVYIRWVEPRDSVLDAYREKTEQDIAASKSVAELAALYAEAKRKVDEEEAKPRAADDREQDYERFQREPYKSRQLLEGAISERESHRRQLWELHFFWLCGLLFVLLGMAAYFQLNRWFGITLLVLGYLEMIWVTVPSFRTFGAAQEFDRLLTAKVIYSAATLVLVLIVWRYVARQMSESRSKTA
jgi:hypothetical protein